MSPYSLSHTIAAIHSFYIFLTTLPSDISPHSILSPPSPHGWPSLNPHYLSLLHKSPDVVTLLQHLPYIDHNAPGCTQVAFQTRVLDFRGRSVRWALEKKKVEGLLEPAGAGVLPEWVVCLTAGGREGSWLLLDTREGTITDFIQQERPERPEPAEDSPYFWRAYHTLPVAEFLEDWKQNFRSLRWVAVPGDVLDGMMIRHDKKTDEVRDIYRAYGWPDQFNREECREALLNWAKHYQY